MSELKLGKATDYISKYAPSLLDSIPRAKSPLRASLDTLPFQGVDIWQAYEVSWLDRRGKPQVATLQLEVPCASRFLIESKSLKLYLNSFNQTEFENRAEVIRTLEADLNLAAGAPVIVSLQMLDHLEQQGFSPLTGECLDTLEIDVRHYQREPALLKVDAGEVRVRETLFSHLLRSCCPITGQPDWGSLWVQYSGAPIDRVSLLRYIISYREHEGFHEDTVEQIFCDLLEVCRPDSLHVVARYTRRGGIEVNPVRSTDVLGAAPGRLGRQ